MLSKSDIPAEGEPHSGIQAFQNRASSAPHHEERADHEAHIDEHPETDPVVVIQLRLVDPIQPVIEILLYSFRQREEEFLRRSSHSVTKKTAIST